MFTVDNSWREFLGSHHVLQESSTEVICINRNGRQISIHIRPQSVCNDELLEMDG